MSKVNCRNLSGSWGQAESLGRMRASHSQRLLGKEVMKASHISQSKVTGGRGLTAKSRGQASCRGSGSPIAVASYMYQSKDAEVSSIPATAAEQCSKCSTWLEGFPGTKLPSESTRFISCSRHLLPPQMSTTIQSSHTSKGDRLGVPNPLPVFTLSNI